MIKAGDTYTHKVTYTQQQVIEFAEASGDRNPIHLDAEFAATTPFGRPIVHGFLAAAVFSKVFGMLFPGAGTIYLSQQMKFLAPVFTGQEYTAEFEVTEVDTVKHNGLVRTVLRDQNGQECIVGEAKLKHKTQFV
ncbi:MAG: MaoC family dehydratase [Tidjanibacter sp.]|nr:MaoC family dehydratase [Tidjanibacter sp.]